MNIKLFLVVMALTSLVCSVAAKKRVLSDYGQEVSLFGCLFLHSAAWSVSRLLLKSYLHLIGQLLTQLTMREEHY